MKKFFFHLFIFISFFLFINFVLAFLWTPLSVIKAKILKHEHYTDEVLKLINIEKKEEENFYREMWPNNKYKYVQFAEHLEAKTEIQKYVNITQEYGRKINNSNICNFRYFFYGDSQVFGYNVKDNQTIPAFFKDILIKNSPNKNICVYNFGSANYFSTQENILLIKHILEDKVKKNDFAIFLNGHIENGNQRSGISSVLDKSVDQFYYNRWEKLKYSSITFFNSLPVIIIYKRLHKNFSQKENIDEKKVKELSSILNNIDETQNIFKKNLMMRNSICGSMNINCYTFIKPFPKIHGKSTKTFLRDEISYMKMKYLALSKTKNTIDISQILDNEQEISYIDKVHFSPNSNKLIAYEIHKQLNN